MHPIKLVVFDMAGTVVNEDNIVYKILQKSINRNGYLLTLDFVLEHGAGKQIQQAIKDILLQIDALDVHEECKEIFKYFNRLLEKAYSHLDITTYKGVESLIKTLKKRNVKVALNTGYDKNTAQLLLDKMKWKLNVNYDLLITHDDVAQGRPNPDMIFETMDVFKIEDAATVVKAGDSILDIEEGKNAHCGITIGVTTGAHTKEQLQSAKPTYVLDSLSELKDIFITNNLC